MSKPLPRQIIPLVLALLLLPLLAAAAVAGVEIPDGANEWCPVTSDRLAKAEHFTEHEGTRIFFCCARCRSRFEQNPAAYIAAHTPAPSPSIQPHAPQVSPADGHALHGHAEHPSRFLNWLGRLHPLAVHFPIAFLPVASAIELLRLRRTRVGLAESARLCVWIGTLGALTAAALGWLLAGFQVADGDWVTTSHRWLGTTTALCALASLLSGEAQRTSGSHKARSIYLALLCLCTLLIGLTAFLGASITRGLDHLAW